MSGRTCTALLAVALCAGCRLERRPDAPGTEVAIDQPALDAATDSAEAVLGAMTSALEGGDPSRVSQLATPDAVLIDQTEGIRWTRAEATGPLPPAMHAGTGELGWRLLDSSYSRLAPEAALFSLRYGASVSEDTIPRTALESWVIVREEGSWKVRYLHRSRGLTPDASRP